MYRCTTALGLALLAGCQPYFAAIWLVHLPEQELECTTRITENFNEAEAPVEDEATLDWISTLEVESSDRLLFMQIEEGRGNEVFLLVSGSASGVELVYPGTRDGKVLKFAWETSNSTQNTQSHTSGYDYDTSTDVEVTNEITFEQNPDTKGMNGKWAVTSELTQGWAESDEWVESVGFQNGQINGAVQTHLVGTFPFDAANQSTIADCTGGTCQLTVSDACEGDLAFTAQLVDFEDEDSFDHAESYGQPPG